MFQPADEEVRLLELLQPRGRIGPAEDLVAELRRELAEHARPEEKEAALLVQRAEELLVQVVGDEPVSAAELTHGTVRIFDAPEPEQCEIERAGPAFGPPAEDLHLFGIERKAAGFDEELAGFGELECEVARAELGQGSVRAQLGKPQRRVGAGQDEEPRRRGQVSEREIERFDAIPVGHDLEVVQHDVQLGPVRRDPVHQLDDPVLDAESARAETPQRGPAEAAPDPVDRRCDVAPEAHGIVVSAIERHPRKPPCARLAPCADGGGLPVPRGSGDERECGTAFAGVEHGLEAGPLDHPGPKLRREQLGLGERRPLILRPRASRGLRPRVRSVRSGFGFGHGRAQLGAVRVMSS